MSWWPRTQRSGGTASASTSPNRSRRGFCSARIRGAATFSTGTSKAIVVWKSRSPTLDNTNVPKVCGRLQNQGERASRPFSFRLHGRDAHAPCPNQKSASKGTAVSGPFDHRRRGRCLYIYCRVGSLSARARIPPTNRSVHGRLQTCSRRTGQARPRGPALRSKKPRQFPAGVFVSFLRIA